MCVRDVCVHMRMGVCVCVRMCVYVYFFVVHADACVYGVTLTCVCVICVCVVCVALCCGASYRGDN